MKLWVYQTYMNITTNDSQILLALNKPKGYLVTRSDDLGRKTVYNLLPDWLFQDGWMPIGRLDKVLDLNRVSIGSFKPNIEIGKWRYLSIDEEKILIKS